MLIAKNVEDTEFDLFVERIYKHYEDPINVLGQDVCNQLCIGPITINIPKNNIGNWSVNGVNLQILQMTKELRAAANESGNYFAQMISANTLTRPTIIVYHKELEEDYVIDRVQQSFIVHADAIDDNSVYMWGSAFPEMYNNDLPLVRIFSTNVKTGTIKEVRYYSDTLEPKTYYTTISDDRYEQLISLRRDNIFIINHDGSRFQQKVAIKPFMKLIVSRDYVARMEKRCHGNVIKLLNWYFHNGLPENINDDMIHCVDDDIDEIKHEIEQYSNYSTPKGPKWVFVGFGYDTTQEARKYAQSFSVRSKHQEKRYVKPDKPKTEKRDTSNLVIPNPPEEVMKHYAEKAQRRAKHKNKRDYMKRVDQDY